MEVRMRLFVVAAVLAALAWPAAAEKTKATIYKDPQCGCCGGHADHLRANGFEVTEIPSKDLMKIKREHGVPGQLAACHTAVIGGYVVEGHVPSHIIRRLLDEKPKIKGISLPGMPMGTPGMPGPKTEPFVYYELGTNPPRVFATE
jgi:hypothetical protein